MQALFAQNQYTIFQYNQPHDSADYMHCAAKNYIEHNYDTSVIFAMSIGTQDFATVTEEPPFSETKQKVHTSIFRPSGAILKEEVLCCAHFISKRAYKTPEDNPLRDIKYKNIRLPQPSAWKKDQLYIFLNNHEFVAQGEDLDFIRGKIEEYKNKLNLEFNKQKKKPDETSWDRSGWGVGRHCPERSIA
jgi:hypothetical protein